MFRIFQEESKQKYPKINKLTTSLDNCSLSWIAANILIEVLLRSFPNTSILRIRYEDLEDRLVNEMNRIGMFVGLDLSPMSVEITSGKEISIGHTTAGYRLRMY